MTLGVPALEALNKQQIRKEVKRQPEKLKNGQLQSVCGFIQKISPRTSRRVRAQPERADEYEPSPERADEYEPKPET